MYRYITSRASHWCSRNDMEAGIGCKKVFLHLKRSVLSIVLLTGLLYRLGKLHQNQSRWKSSRFCLVFPEAGRSKALSV